MRREGKSIMAKTSLDREKVLDAAEKMINEEGLQCLGIQSLARFLKVKPPSLYNHVEGIEDIRGALAIRALKSIRRNMTEHMLGFSGEDAIRALCKAYLAYAKQNPGLYELSQEARQWAYQDIQDETEALVLLAKRSLAPYGLKPDEEIHAIRTIRSLLHGFAGLRAQGFAMTVPVEESIDYGVEMFLSGLSKNRR